MSAWMLGVVSVLYAGTAIDLWLRSNHALAIAFACYSAANLCLLATIK